MNGTPSTKPRADLSAASAASPILRSWERCSLLHKDLQAEPVVLARAALQDRFEQHASLLRAAQPELETLAGMVANASGIVLLTDDAGVVLQSQGDAAFLRRADQVALRPGASWAESHLGTNGVGTALIEGRPVRVHGSEHFLPRNRILSCHGAPIRSPRGDILGVLDISCDAGRLHAYALELAAMFARQVTNRIMEQAAGQPSLLVFHHQPAMLDSADRAQLMVHDNRIIGANDAAVALLGASWRQLLDQPVFDWLGDGWQHAARQTAAVHTPQGMPLFARLKPVHDAPVMVATPSRSMPPHDAHAVVSTGQPAFHARQPATDMPRPAAGVRPAVTARPARLPPLADALRPGFNASLRALQAGMAVLLQGETGTGKEVYARWLHASGERSSGPFVAINCGALPESLIEAELFGYAPGAFTGAQRHGTRGRLREAHGGMLFLDEIGDMPLLLQTRLLRALQEREVQPLGGDKAIAVDFHLISATNQDLAQRVREGRFRADLYYRLQDYRVALPPLSQRPDLRAFLCAEFNRNGALAQGLTLHDSALDCLCAYRWPGNYRELLALLRGLVIHFPPGSLIGASDLPDPFRQSWIGIDAAAMSAAGATWREPPVDAANDDAPPHAGQPSGTLQELNAHRIRQAMQAHGGNISRAARSLGIHRSTLHRYLARLNTQH